MASKAAPGASGGSHAVSSQNTVSSASYPADSNVVPAPHCDAMITTPRPRIINDSALVRMNKVHGKIADRQEAKRVLCQGCCQARSVYKDAIEKAEQEQKQGRSEGIRTSYQTHFSMKSLNRSEVGIEPEMLPFQPGDQVVAKIEEWILANMIGYVPDKGTYEVEDAEDSDTSTQAQKRYFVAPKMLIAIPKSTGSTKEFPVKQRVLALFPSTTCFYQATVVLPPSSTLGNQYVVVFEDDNSFERNVEARMVLEWPKHM
ncbi:hypothetical protein BSLG_010292 [Batrachochytrium salamandrivorans]|nr:hypothetical protein BSLG_010292 [Batrachochytrium salamandrivorans]